MNGTDLVEGANQGYIRKASGQQTTVVSGVMIYNATANDTFVTRFYRGDNSTTGTADRVAAAGGVQILQLDAVDNFARYSTTATNSLTSTEKDVANWTNDQQETGFSRATNVVTITTAGRYLMTFSGTTSETGSTRIGATIFLNRGATPVTGVRGYSHMRGADGTQNGGLSFAAIVDVAANDTFVLRSDADNGTMPLDSGAVWQWWQLPSGNETAIMEATTGNMNSGTELDFIWDTLSHIDTAAFTATAGNANIDTVSNSHMLAFWNQGKTTIDTVQRAFPTARPAISGTPVNYARSGQYHRNSASIGTFMAHGGAALLNTVLNGSSITIVNNGLGAAGTINTQSGHFSLLNLEGLYKTYTYNFPITISDVDTDEILANTQSAVVITGISFGATQGTGLVELVQFNTYTGTKVTQSGNLTWSDTSITVDIAAGALADTICYLYVTNNSGARSFLQVQAGIIPFQTLVVDSLKCDHYWRLNNVYSDTGSTGPVRDMTQTPIGTWTFSTTPIVDGNTHALIYNSTTNRRECADSPNMNITISSAERTLYFALRLDGTQHQMACIWKEGGGVQNIAFFVGIGNTLLFQCADVPGNAINAQAWSDFKLEVGRIYYVCGIYSLVDSEVRLFIDGVQQANTDGNPLGAGTFNSHSGDVTWGDPDTNLETGGTDISYNTLNNAVISDFLTFSDNSLGVDAGRISNTNIRDILYRRAAKPTDTLVADTQTNMQTALGLLTATRANSPLSLRVPAPSSGGPNLELRMEDSFLAPWIHSDLTITHAEWRGSGVLTLVNPVGGNTDVAKCWSVSGRTISVVNEVQLTVTALDINTNAAVSGARVRLTAASGGPEVVGTVLLSGVTDVSGQLTGVYRYSSDQPITGRIRQGTTSPFYKTGDIVETITTNGLNLTTLLIKDE